MTSVQGVASKVPDIVWAPVAAGVLTAVVALTGLAFGVPWLFPSLGPTIFLLVQQPSGETSRIYNVLVGHTIGGLGAALAVVATTADSAPPVLSSGELTWERAAAAIITMPLILLAQIALKANHPPAAATALLVALGGFSLSWHDAGVLTAGIFLTAVLGEALRLARLKG